MNIKIIKTLLQLNKKIYNLLDLKIGEFEIFNDDRLQFYFDTDKIDNLILDLLEIPKDTSEQYYEDMENPKCFCRDYYSELLYEYYEDIMNEDELIKKIENENKTN